MSAWKKFSFLCTFQFVTEMKNRHLQFVIVKNHTAQEYKQFQNMPFVSDNIMNFSFLPLS